MQSYNQSRRGQIFRSEKRQVSKRYRYHRGHNKEGQPKVNVVIPKWKLARQKVKDNPIIEYIIKKINSRLTPLYRNGNWLDKRSMPTLGNSLD